VKQSITTSNSNFVSNDYKNDSDYNYYFNDEEILIENGVAPILETTIKPAIDYAEVYGSGIVTVK
jgi:hypothetical protein